MISGAQMDFCVDKMVELRDGFEKQGNKPGEISNFGYPNVAAGIRLQVSKVGGDLVKGIQVYFPLASSSLCAIVKFSKPLERIEFSHNRLIPELAAAVEGVREELNAVVRNVIGKEFLKKNDTKQYSNGLRISTGELLDPNQYVRGVEEAKAAEKDWWATSERAKLVKGKMYEGKSAR